MENPLESRFATAEIAAAEQYLDHDPPTELDPRVERLVNELIGRVADKWTMLILELLEERGTLRFTEIGRAVEGISQKMLTQTLRALEANGLVARHDFATVPPHVEYELTPLGVSLGDALGPLFQWIEGSYPAVVQARTDFAARQAEAA